MIQPGVWKPAAGLTLEPNAATAAKSQSGSIALLAGPGAGKTEMLAQRADFLLRTATCRYPKRILAISFKRDASENLKQRVTKRCGKDLAARFDSYTFHAFSKRLIDIFRPILTGQNQLNENYTIEDQRAFRTQITFNDMVPLALEILDSCPIAVNSIKHSYSDVFLDEFQDCTDQQYKLIKQAFIGTQIRLVAVGDTKQKIMGWAGALEGIFVSFQDDFDASPINLYQNFRSEPRIRRVHNSMVRDIDPDAAVEDANIEGDSGAVTIEQFANESEEANWIADSIVEWIQQGIPKSEIAILCNTQPHLYAKAIMDALDERDIPFRNEQVVQDLFCEPIFQLLVDYLTVLIGEKEPEAWQRLLGTLIPPGIEDIDDRKTREWNKFLSQQKRIISQEITPENAWNSAEEMVARVGRESFTAMSHDYENLARFTDLISLTKEIVTPCFEKDCVSESIKGLAEVDAVRILTIHKCKGLEFDTVIVQGAEEETFFGNQADTECAFFVAISRARKNLIVTRSDFRTKLPGANWRWSEGRTPHSQFLGYVETHVGGC